MSRLDVTGLQEFLVLSKTICASVFTLASSLANLFGHRSPHVLARPDGGTVSTVMQFSVL